MFQTLKNAWKTPDLKSKLLFTLLIVILYRLGSAIFVPWVNSELVSSYLSINTNYSVQMIAGDAFGQATLFALSVSPYITASIIIQLLTIAIPALERLAKEGEEGKKKINMITRIVTMGLALVTAWGYANLLNANGLINFGKVNPTFGLIVIIACYCAGAAIVMWMAEKINEFGIGNGISIILFANIVARVPSTFISLFTKIFTRDVSVMISGIIWTVIIAALGIGLVWLVVWFTESERRIPVQYAKRVVGRKMYGGQSSHLPLKLNMSGVMPVIFANSIVSIPGTLATIFSGSKGLQNLSNNYFNYTKPLYVLLSVILLFAFAYFYIMISFNPVEVANNIRNNGGAVPGIRPGKPTRDYIQKILNRITFIGAVFLCIVSEVPKIVVSLFETFKEVTTLTGRGTVAQAIVDFYNNGSDAFLTVAFAGTSILIVVGVVLETVRELEAQLTMRNYKGFLD